MDTIDNDRRKWLGFGAAALGLALLPNHAFASLTTPRPKILRFENLNTGEFLKAEFFDGKRYNRSELARLNKLFPTTAVIKSKPLTRTCLTRCICCR